MKVYKYLLAMIPVIITSCSYLPDDTAYMNNTDFRETSEYIFIESPLENKDEVVLFLPGALVDPHAYISLMNRVAIEGYDVIILKFPANLGILELSKARSITREFDLYKKWYIAGHSLGGISAQAAVHNDPDLFRGLILLGVYPSKGYQIKDWHNNVLSLYAEFDGLSTQQEVNNNKGYLPSPYEISSTEEIDSLKINNPSTIYYLIKGGNHSQFGDYGFQKGDGNASISKERQHEEISDAITKFISWNENNN